MIIFPKRTTAPPTPSADKLTLYVDTNEVLSYIGDLGITRNLAPWVQTTTFTPGISFGGGTTGITYATQVGRYERVGTRVFATGFIALSSKGSSVGVAVITGLPVAANGTASSFQAVTLRFDDLTGITGAVQGYIAPSGTTIVMEFLGTGVKTVMANTHYQNSTSTMFSVMYES